MATKRNQVPRRLEEAIQALLTSPTIREAAARLGLNERTLRNWMDRDDFKQAFRAVRKSLIDHATSRMEALSGKALDTLEKNLTCGQHAVETSAAKTIWDIVVRVVEQNDIRDRMDAVEQQLQLAERGNQNR